MLIRTAAPDDRRAIDALLARIELFDGFEPLSEHKRMALDQRKAAALIAVAGGDVVALLQTATYHGEPDDPDADWEIEIAIDPDHRSTQVFERVIVAAPAIVPKPAMLWTLDERTASHTETTAMIEVRSLHLLERELPADEARIPRDIEIESFRPGVDEDRWLLINNEAFAGHPEQSGWTVGDLSARMDLDWFDPDGLFLASDSTGMPLGSVWTKMHRGYEGGPAGEIYIIGVRPVAQGRGLGTLLTMYGLADLERRQGARKGILWVEGSNEEALRMYKRLGFEVSRIRRSFGYDPAHQDDQPNG